MSREPKPSAAIDQSLKQTVSILHSYLNEIWWERSLSIQQRTARLTVLAALLLGVLGSSTAATAVVAADFNAKDLLGNSVTCNEKRETYPHLEQCNLRDEPSQALASIQVRTIQEAGLGLAESLKKDYFLQVEAALSAQFQVATWLTGENPLHANLSQNAEAASLLKAVDTAMVKCSGKERSQLAGLVAKFKSAKLPMSMKTASVPAEFADRQQEFFKKRMLIAWIELSRIERFLTDRPLSKDQKSLLRARAEKIRTTYPLVADSNGAHTLVQQALAHYGEVFSADSTTSHPQLDQILFPSAENGKYAVIAPGKALTQGHSGMVNQILDKPLPPQIDKAFSERLAHSLRNSFDSIGSFCGLNACQTMQLRLQRTAQKVSQNPEAAGSTMAAVCSCKLLQPAEHIGMLPQLVLSGVAIGGTVLCPFTMGIGCYVAAASAAGLTAASAVNTVGALSDLHQVSQVAKAAQALPGFSIGDRAEVKRSETKAMGEVLLQSATTVTAALPVYTLGKQGADMRVVLNSAWRPASPQEMASYFQTHVREVESTATSIYKDHIEYFPNLNRDSINVLKAHDMEKFLNFKKLARKFGYEGVPKEIVEDLADGPKFLHRLSKDGKYVKMSISDALYTLWGHNPDSLKEKIALAKTVDERRPLEALLKLQQHVVTSMESIDNAIMRPAYKAAGSAAARVEIRLLELMADKAVRTGNGITASEMGRAVYPTRQLYEKLGAEGLAKHIADPKSPEELIAARQLIDRIGLDEITRVTEATERRFVSLGPPTSFRNTVQNMLSSPKLPSKPKPLGQ